MNVGCTVIGDRRAVIVGCTVLVDCDVNKSSVVVALVCCVEIVF